MADPLHQVCCACVPRTALSSLATLRRETGITVTMVDDRAWVFWEAGRSDVLQRILPLRDAALFARREGHWYRPGDHLPSFAVPPEECDSLPLHRVIIPSRIEPLVADGKVPPPARLRLVRDDRVRPTAALRCDLADVGRWAETAPTERLEALRGAWDGSRVNLLGRRLPELATAERFWGGGVLTPLGFRATPQLCEPALRRALGVAGGEIVLLDPDGFEVVPVGAFRPLTRASVRLAQQGSRS